MRLLGDGVGEGGVYLTRGVYQRGASNTNYTPQGGRLLDTGRLFESGRLLDHLLNVALVTSFVVSTSFS